MQYYAKAQLLQVRTITFLPLLQTRSSLECEIHFFARSNTVYGYTAMEVRVPGVNVVSRILLRLAVFYSTRLTHIVISKRYLL